MRRSNLVFLLAGVVVGLLAGIGIGLLIAPQSGVQTRRRLADEATRAAGLARDFADRAEQVADSLGDRVDRALGRDQEVAWRKVREIRESMQEYTQAQG